MRYSKAYCVDLHDLLCFWNLSLFYQSSTSYVVSLFLETILNMVSLTKVFCKSTLLLLGLKRELLTWNSYQCSIFWCASKFFVQTLNLYCSLNKRANGHVYNIFWWRWCKQTAMSYSRNFQFLTFANPPSELNPHTLVWNDSNATMTVDIIFIAMCAEERFKSKLEIFIKSPPMVIFSLPLSRLNGNSEC